MEGTFSSHKHGTSAHRGQFSNCHVIRQPLPHQHLQNKNEKQTHSLIQSLAT